MQLLNKDEQARLVAAARDATPVRGLTHGFYKYPARFSPNFVRAAIEIFSAPGDLILDPHVGGGTTLVEALASGREAVGIDISTLSEFVTKTKCTIYSKADLAVLEDWAQHIASKIDLRKSSQRLRGYALLGYYKHLNHPSRWRLRKAIEQALMSAVKLDNARLEAFARCVVLRSAQGALDGRYKQTSIEEFRAALQRTAHDMLAGANELRSAVKQNGRMPIKMFCRSSAGIESMYRRRPPRLVVTSPPYPGVHVLYHRWQVDGRKESPLPFMIANKLDGAGGSYYTMGDRHAPQLRTYFDGVQSTMSSVAKISDGDTIIVQMLAFSEPRWQLPRYLEAMNMAGLEEFKLSTLKNEKDGRLWRKVPGRRWYSEQRGETPASQEVVLFYRKAMHPHQDGTRSTASSFLHPLSAN